MSGTIEGATEQLRWVCNGCGRSMQKGSIKRHMSRCPKNPISKRCGSCAHENYHKACAAGIVREVRRADDWTEAYGDPICVDGPCAKWEAGR